MTQKSFSIKVKIWRWPAYADKHGDGGWHFATLDRKLSEQIRKVYTKGFVKIKAKIGKTEWDTSLFPHMPNKKVSKSVDYLLCINKKVLKKEELFVGEEIKIQIVIK